MSFNAEREILRQQRAILLFREMVSTPELLTASDLRYIPDIFLMAYFPSMIEKLWSRLPLNLRNSERMQQYRHCKTHSLPNEEPLLRISCPFCPSWIQTQSALLDVSPPNSPLTNVQLSPPLSPAPDPPASPQASSQASPPPSPLPSLSAGITPSAPVQIPLSLMPDCDFM